MMFWVSSSSAAAITAQVAVRMDTMRKAEAGLISIAHRFGNTTKNNTNNTNSNEESCYRMELFDTKIPVSVLPFHPNAVKKNNNSGWTNYYWNIFSGSSKNEEEEEEFTMHAIRVTKKEESSTSSQVIGGGRYPQKYPLVIVHGYMNGALYFYRNLVGLANFFDTVISIDLLGWGLSSRPSFLTRMIDDTVETTEDFFVESLESWRSTNDIDKMVLAGHSMGGYLSVAYCEKYPHRVDRLLLLSPAGIPDDPPERIEKRRSEFLTSYSRKAVYGFFGKMWEYGYTPGSVMRTIPESRGRALVEGYVRNRLPSVTDPEEQTTLVEYMYTGSILPGSGEYALNKLLLPGAIAKNPCLHRIPKLRVPNVSFFYGVRDWMDANGGLDVQEICRAKKKKQQQQQEQQLQKTSSSSTTNNEEDNDIIIPNIDVYQVRDAGHLLMLENSDGFNAAVITACGGRINDVSNRPIVPMKKTTYYDPAKLNKNADNNNNNNNAVASSTEDDDRIEEQPVTSMSTS